MPEFYLPICFNGCLDGFTQEDINIGYYSSVLVVFLF